jgi:2-C-methyl-D-erythritol 4-phosphate cytidylyltransferase
MRGLTTEPDPTFIGLLLAAGRSSRLGAGLPKPYLPLRGRTVLEWSAVRIARLPGHQGTILAVDADALASRIPALRRALGASGVIEVVAGGDTRQDSCQRAFAAAEAIGRPTDLVLVHDCARPFFSLAATRRALALARRDGGAILGQWARDTLKVVRDDGAIDATLPRDHVFQAATPQVFRRDDFRRMLATAEARGIVATDESGLAEAAGITVHAVECGVTNVKLTWPEDLRLLPALEPILDHDD